MVSSTDSWTFANTERAFVPFFLLIYISKTAHIPSLWTFTTLIGCSPEPTCLCRSLCSKSSHQFVSCNNSHHRISSEHSSKSSERHPYTCCESLTNTSAVIFSFCRHHTTMHCNIRTPSRPPAACDKEPAGSAANPLHLYFRRHTIRHAWEEIKRGTDKNP